jgi:hypothetical protein
MLALAANETVLAVVLGSLVVYFSVMVFRGLRRYVLFRRVRPTALLTWVAPPPAHFRLLIVLGLVSAGLAVLNAYLGRPVHHVLAQALIAVYFVLTVPLLTGIPLGLYRDGVWADAGFVPYSEIGRMAFRETPEIVLILLPRGRSRPLKLPVPPGEYGAVRKVLEQMKREGVMGTQERILGL